MDELVDRLRHIVAARTRQSTPYPPEIQVFGGFDTVRPPRPYLWDGMKRGADPAHPYLIFQYTLAGWGRYTTHGVDHRLVPGIAFTAIIPSEHVYSLPAASSGWTFFWIILHHGYIVDRISRRQQSTGPLLTLEPHSPLVLRAVDLLAQAVAPTPHDAITQEQALFDFLWEHERVSRRRGGTQSEGERLLDDVRHYVRDALPQPVGAAELAARYGKSRTHFSHLFKDATGLTPAQFIQHIRMEEATRQLLHSDEPIDRVAAATGFANANHFCKVFRRRFHLSPGAFRRQLR